MRSVKSAFVVSAGGRRIRLHSWHLVSAAPKQLRGAQLHRGSSRQFEQGPVASRIPQNSPNPRAFRRLAAISAARRAHSGRVWKAYINLLRSPGASEYLMKLLPRISAVVSLVVLGSGLLALRSSAQWYGSSPFAPVTPEQTQEKAEFSWSRLRYTSVASSFGGGGTATTALAAAAGCRIIPRPTASSCSPCVGSRA